MDVGLQGWGPPRYSWSCTMVHCRERALCFKSTFLCSRQLVRCVQRHIHLASFLYLHPLRSPSPVHATGFLLSETFRCCSRYVDPHTLSHLASTSFHRVLFGGSGSGHISSMGCRLETTHSRCSTRTLRLRLYVTPSPPSPPPHNQTCLSAADWGVQIKRLIATIPFTL